VVSATAIQKKAIRFHARSFVAFALAPEAPLGVWLRGLDRWLENSPGFFVGRPVALDLNLLKPTVEEITDLVTHLAGRGIRVYAIEYDGADDLGPTLPPVLKGAKAATIDETPVGAPPQTPAAQQEPPEERKVEARTLLIESPVRSGQSVFHPHGDVVVLGSVGSGSEVIASGSIHIYGTLRGRAIAGVNGNSEARIFCHRNEAELLAIDGWYRTADDMDAGSRSKPVQAYLKNDVILVAALD